MSAPLSASGIGGEPRTVSVRVMTYNIHHGRGMDEKVDLDRIASVITTEKPDLVALQEVDRGVRRTAGRDLPGELAKLTGMRAYFDRNILFEGGEYGNAVLTRLPVLQEANLHLQMLRDDEQRGAIHTLLEVEGERLLFVNTHIDYRTDDTERLQSVEQLKEIVASHGGLPAVVVGDFNDFPGSRTHQRMKEQFTDAWEAAGDGDGFTFRADRPDRRIDFVWLSKDLVPTKVWVGETMASDHFPLIADLEIRIGK